MRYFVLISFGLLAGCGHGDKAAPAISLPTIAETSDISVVRVDEGPTPFISWVNLQGHRLPALKTISYVIEPKPGTVSKPVHVTYSLAALRERGKIPDKQSLQLPLFGLYADYANLISISISFSDGSVQVIPLAVQTGVFVDPAGVYSRPTFIQRRISGSDLGFDFIVLKSNLGSPIVIDSDGEMRWAASGVASGVSSELVDNVFLIGDPQTNVLYHLELDGTLRSVPLEGPDYLRFHHNLDRGRTGLLGEFDTVRGVESTIAEFDSSGSIVKEWDLAKILSDYMAAHGDNASQFVRPGIDWFHSNAATYDPRDNSLLVSSRENFVLKLDYDTGELLWVFGDTEKYWASFPSLRAKALTLEQGGLIPIGQHGLSITADGLLMMFNNGFQSQHQPAGAPAGGSRDFSTVSAYQIDGASMVAREVWRFDYDESISSIVCSSAYEAADRSLLIDYAYADAGTHARIVGLDPDHHVVFDIQYENPGGCNTSWNAIPIAFENLSFG